MITILPLLGSTHSLNGKPEGGFDRFVIFSTTVS